MKKAIFTIFCIAALMVLTAFRIASDILQKLGIEQSEGQYSIQKNVFNENIFSIPNAKLLSSAVTSDKKVLARELCIYIRQYCESDDFFAAYAKERDSRKPASEPPKALDAETIKQMEELAKMYEEWSRNNSYDAKTRESFKTQAADIRKQLETEKDPHPNKTKWEKEYPANPNALIRKKLEEAVSIIESVDFDATTTVNKYGQRIFDNPEYEKKSKKWKACYRAGKEVCDEVKLFIKNWLKEGIKTGTGKMVGSENINTAGNKTADKQSENATNESQTLTKEKKLMRNLKSKVLGKAEN
jgi:hypothetical protein